ncbi:MAG TPA: phosphatidate cytidylyltransferase [Rudaea sp.]|nr:phosphatidate cytidylyltransferase [Rudaea sp.]
MMQRVVTALLITPPAVALVLLLPQLGFAVLVAALSLMALWEWTRLSGLRDRRIRACLLALTLVLFAVLWVYRATAVAWLTIVIGCVWWVVALAWLQRFTFAAARTRENTAIKLLAGGLAVVPAWTAIVLINGDPHYGSWWSLFALALSWSADTFAYLAGSRWGRRKLAPNISPGKTFAGVYGALIGTAVFATICGWLLGVSMLKLPLFVVLALVCVGFSIVGDLFESLIKRHAGVKDSGAMFPGHGGVYDRLDSAFAVLPIFAVGKALLGL